MHIEEVREVLNEGDRRGTYSEGDLWICVRPHLTDQKELGVLDWQLRRKGGALVWSVGGEFRTLEGIWKRLVEDKIGKITKEQRAESEREQWAALAGARRQAEEHERRRQL